MSHCNWLRTSFHISNRNSINDPAFRYCHLFHPIKKVFTIELTVPFEENFDWAHQRKLEKYKDLWEQCVRNGWITNVFPIKVRCWGFITNSTSIFLTNLRLSPSDKRKYIKNIQDKDLSASVWIWQSHRVMSLQQSLGIMMLWPWNHAWT